MTTIQSVGQAYASATSTQASSSVNTSVIARGLEDVFTHLAAAVQAHSGTNSGSGAIDPGSANAVVNSLSQVLGHAITAFTGQSTNLEALLGPSTASASQLYQTSGGAAVGGAGAATSTAGAAASTAGVSAVSGNSAGFSEDQLYQMIHTSLSQNSDPSQNDLSGPQNIQYWDPSTAQGKKNLDSFYTGIVTAHNQFFPNVPIQTFARGVVAEAGAESTLNPTAGNGGLLQVTPADAVADYNNHGTAIKDANGNTALSPGAAWDANNPETNVLMWAWYNKNSVANGGVAPNNWGKGQNNGVSNTYGNILANWLGGPGDKLGQGTDYYVGRIQRFFEKPAAPVPTSKTF